MSRIFKRVSSWILPFVLINSINCIKNNYTALNAAKRGKEYYEIYKSRKRVSTEEEFQTFIGEYDSEWGYFMTKYKEGIIEYHRGNFDKSLQLHRTALKGVKSYKGIIKKTKALKEGLPGVVYCYGFGLTFSALQGIYSDSAQFYLEKARKEFQKIGFKDGLADCYEYQGDLNLESNHLVTARQKYQKALTCIPNGNLYGKMIINGKIAKTFSDPDSISFYIKRTKRLEDKMREKCKGKICPIKIK